MKTCPGEKRKGLVGVPDSWQPVLLASHPFPRGPLSPHTPQPNLWNCPLPTGKVARPKTPADLHLSPLSDLRITPCLLLSLHNGIALTCGELVARPLRPTLGVAQMILRNVDHSLGTTDLIPSRSTPSHAKKAALPLVHWGNNGPGFKNSCRPGSINASSSIPQLGHQPSLVGVDGLSMIALYLCTFSRWPRRIAIRLTGYCAVRR